MNTEPAQILKDFSIWLNISAQLQHGKLRLLTSIVHLRFRIVLGSMRRIEETVVGNVIEGCKRTDQRIRCLENITAAVALHVRISSLIPEVYLMCSLVVFVVVIWSAMFPNVS